MTCDKCGTALAEYIGTPKSCGGLDALGLCHPCLEALPKNERGRARDYWIDALPGEALTKSVDARRRTIDKWKHRHQECLERLMETSHGTDTDP